MNVVVLLYSTVFTRIETSKGLGSRKSEVESDLNCIVFCSPANVSKFLQTIFYYTKYYLSRASKVINNPNGKVNYRKSELGLPAQQFRVPVFYFRVPGARFSKVPVIIPSPESCFTWPCLIYKIQKTPPSDHFDQ